MMCRYPVCGFLGLPFTHAATVRSITHLKSLTDYTTEHIGDGQVPGPVTKQLIDAYVDFVGFDWHEQYLRAGN